MILIDTNMLVAQVQFRTNIIKQLKNEDREVVVLSPVMMELERLAIGNSEDAMASRVAIEVVKNERLRLLDVSLKNADNAILEYAKMMKAENRRVAVATNDKMFIEKLKIQGITVYRLRQKKIIERVE